MRTRGGGDPAGVRTRGPWRAGVPFGGVSSGVGPKYQVVAAVSEQAGGHRDHGICQASLQARPRELCSGEPFPGELRCGRATAVGGIDGEPAVDKDGSAHFRGRTASGPLACERENVRSPSTDSPRRRSGMTVPGPTDYFLRPGDAVTQFVFFLSSGSDVAAERDLFDLMVREASNQFRLRRDPARPFTFEVDRWEHDAPRRTIAMNEEFVRRACESHATVVLLSTEVRRGTREEIEGVLAQQKVQLSIIWMEDPQSRNRSKPLKKFLAENQDKFAYYRTGAPGSPEAIVAMVGVIAAALADITRGARGGELFNEAR